jgi:hypothetical protein
MSTLYVQYEALIEQGILDIDTTFDDWINTIVDEYFSYYYCAM